MIVAASACVCSNRLRTAFLAGLALLLSAAAGAEPVVLKVHHFLPPTSNIHTRMIVPWCEKIRQESRGDVSCRIHPAMQLGGAPTQLYDQVRDGVVDVVFAVPGFTAGRFPRIEVFELPFLMKNAQSTSKALWEFVERHAQAEFADVKPLAFNVHGPGLFHLVRKPVTSRADLRGLKIRAPTRQSSRLIAALGGTPIGMPLPEVSQALSKGVIDGLVVPWEIVPAIKVDELTRFHSETDPSQAAMYTTAFVLAMNKARYEGLSADQRKIIDANSGIELSGTFGRIMSEADAGGRAAVPPESINVIPGAEIERWKRLTQPVTEAWVAEMNRKGVDGEALLAAALALTRKHGE
ncbi:MAG TPA: TRAP transporter substrate-binding protein [Burkholderiales bacterium]|jgi:TRAP-type C4-dicarboxylate transport system substrate-binding protein|nr:TRAP transporter substrate-binding protein [Burkholderiales bacterium]